MFLAVGVLAAAFQLGTVADFVFVTGLLFQLVMWFDHWWATQQSH